MNKTEQDIEEKLKELLYCCEGLHVEFSQRNYGNADDWLRHIDKAYVGYQDAIENESEETTNE